MWGTESGVQAPAAQEGRGGILLPTPLPTASLTRQKPPRQPLTALSHCAPAPCASERGGLGAHAAVWRMWWGQMATG
eukprot:SAG25_NODE_9587_length_366_cov_1.936330_1_plen_76_part_01